MQLEKRKFAERGRERIAKGSLGWVMRNSLQRAAETGCLRVAVLDNVVRGFVLFSVPTRGAFWKFLHAAKNASHRH